MAKKPSIIKPPGLTEHIFMGVQGDPGIGKTRLVGSTPGRVLVIRPPQEHTDSWLPADRKRAAQGEIEEAVVNDRDDLDALLQYLRADGGVYDWVWLDNASIMFDVILDDVWDSVIKVKEHRKGGPIDQGEYGIAMTFYARWLRHIVGPDKFNFGFTAHSEIVASPDKDAEGLPIDKLMPWIQGKQMPQRFCGYMNIVAYYHKAKIGGKEGRRVLRTESSPNYYAKDQFDAFGGRVVDPTMPKLLELIEKSPGRAAAGSGTTTQRPRQASRRRVIRKKA
jgi:hypothetical protein